MSREGLRACGVKAPALKWAGATLTWNGEPLRWGGGDGMLHVEDPVPFLAAFEDREADVLVYAGVSYVVEESQDWPRYTRAIALRETWMRWPWQRRERRDSGGDFSDAVVRLIEAQAAGTVADASSTVVPSINSVRRRNPGILSVPATGLAGCTQGRPVDDEAR